MRRGVGSVLFLLASANLAFADPLTDLLAGKPGGICYDRVYDAAHMAKNPDQNTRAIRLSLVEAKDIRGATFRLSLLDGEGTVYAFGDCNYERRAGLDSMGGQLISTFKIGPGLDCHALTSYYTGNSQEGGDFVIDMRDGKSMTIHLPEEIAAWEELDSDGDAGWFPLGREDRIFRVDAASAKLCEPLIDGMPLHR